jgi:hypothetical protein
MADSVSLDHGGPPHHSLPVACQRRHPSSRKSSHIGPLVHTILTIRRPLRVHPQPARPHQSIAQRSMWYVPRRVSTHHSPISSHAPNVFAFEGPHARSHLLCQPALDREASLAVRAISALGSRRARATALVTIPRRRLWGPLGPSPSTCSLPSTQPSTSRSIPKASSTDPRTGLASIRGSTTPAATCGKRASSRMSVPMRF